MDTADDVHPPITIDPSRRLLWKLGLRDVVGLLALAAAAGTLYAGLRLELSGIGTTLETKTAIDDRQTQALDRLSDSITSLNLNITGLRGELLGKGIIGGR